MNMFRSFGKIIVRIFLVLLVLVMLFAVLIAVAFTWTDKTNGSLVSSGQERKYLLYIPEAVDPTEPVPLVISIHGFAEWPAHQKDISQWNALADRYGFIVVYPSGTGFPRRWRSSSKPGISNESTSDIQFISDLIDQLQKDYNIDETRIYANGLSNGGGMSTLLGCKLSKRIAAVGSVSGAYFFSPKDCDFSHPVPLIAFHGTADPIVPYLGDTSSMGDIPFPPVTNWIETWAAQSGCSLSPVKIAEIGNVSGIRYTQCEANAEVIFYTIQGGGHSWPGGEPLPEWIVGLTTQQIDATELMWQFFTQYTLQQ